MKNLQETVENPLQDGIVIMPLDMSGFVMLMGCVDTKLGVNFFRQTVVAVATAIDANQFKVIARPNNDVAHYFLPGMGIRMTNLMLRYLLDEDRSAPAEIIEWLLRLRDRSFGGVAVARAIDYGSTALEAVQWLGDFIGNVANGKFVFEI